MENLTTALSKTIHDTFGDDFRIYSEFSKTDFKLPAFVISSIISGEKQFMGNKYLTENNILIKFYCQLNKTGELYQLVSEKLSKALEYLEVEGDLIRGRNLSFSKKADCLEISVNYDYFFYKKYPVNYMEYLKICER